MDLPITVSLLPESAAMQRRHSRCNRQAEPGIDTDPSKLRLKVANVESTA
jgi:hypothetical protein